MIPWVKELVEKEWECKLHVGLECEHPSGRKVRITSGQFWGEHGVSNFWYWREVLPDGTLGPQEHGYGWM